MNANVYDIRKQESLIYILPNESILKESFVNTKEKIAIAINLYYRDTVEFYLKYLNDIPKQIDIYIISSVQGMWDIIEEYKCNKQNIYLIKKENRGRDISALLVAFREKALEYEYICFLHDKKEHYSYLKKEVDVWIHNLWGNTIGTAKYIENILNTFRENPLIGLLVPPEPVGKYMDSWYGDVWGVDFQNTVSLAKELDLKCDLSEDKQPITIGTVFWARTSCLNKLLSKEWKYTDFPEEPLAYDGTISHAIERIFAYVAQDAGYKTGTVMSLEYAEWKMLFLQDIMRDMNNVLKEQLGLQGLYQLNKDYNKKIQNFFEINKKVYIYGSGVYGRKYLFYLRHMGLEPKGFVVSDNRRKELCIDGLKVHELREIIDEKDTGIIISLNYNLQEEVVEDLLKRGFINFIKGNYDE